MARACDLKLGKQTQAEYGRPKSLNRKNPFSEICLGHMSLNRIGDPTVCIIRACPEWGPRKTGAAGRRTRKSPVADDYRHYSVAGAMSNDAIGSTVSTFPVCC